MAKNIVKTFGEIGNFNIGIKVTVPTTNTTTVVPKSGTACLAGNVPGVAEANVDVNTSITVLNTYCIAELPVNGITTGGGNAAISARDLLYMQTDGTIDKNSSGAGAIKFGTAYGNALFDLTVANKLGTDTRDGQLVASGASQTVIRVWVGKTN